MSGTGSKHVVNGFGELNEIVLAYATTIHKAQDSEYPAVVSPIMTQHYTMLPRAWPLSQERHRGSSLPSVRAIFSASILT